jgi:hypothetical protein
VTVGTIGVVANFGGCSNSNTTPVATGTVATVDPYLYTVYYPADVAYGSVYWADSWAYPTLYQIYPAPTTMTGAAGTTGTTVVTATGAAGAGGHAGATVVVVTKTDGGTTTTAVVTTAGDAIRALARGESVCPGKVTVTARMAAAGCTGGPTAQVRSGATIVFNGCTTAGGGTLNGTVDISATRTASTAVCSASTMISLSHTTTITNLSYVGPSGRALVIPSQTGTGMSTYTFGTTPATIALNYQGELQTFTAPGGSMTSDHNYTAMVSYSFSGSTSSYTANGTVNAVDNLMSGATSSINVTNLQRVTSCCRPVGGTIGIMSTSGTGIGSHTVGFGPSCGEATVDGTTTTLSTCI